MLKQPIGQKVFTNVSIVRLKFGKNRFELACYMNKVQDYREKKEKDIDEVLQSKEIYLNAIKGDLAPKKVLEETFEGMTYDQIIKLILDKGEIQHTEKERSIEINNIKNDVANIIVEKTYNKENGLPFTIDVINQAVDDIKFKYNNKENAKKQALKVIKLLQEKNVLNIERKLMLIKLTLKDNNNKEFDKKKLLEYLKKIECEIIENDEDKLSIKINLKTNYYRDILKNYDSVLNFEILSQNEISHELKLKLDKLNKSNNDSSIQENPNQINEIENEFSNMKISNSRVDDYLEENFGNGQEKDVKIKKNKIKCTKCKGALFEDRDQLKEHYKTKWHKHNCVSLGKEGESLSAEEYDEYVLMHPEELY